MRAVPQHRDSGEHLRVAYSSLIAKPEQHVFQQDMIIVPLSETKNKNILRCLAAASAGKVEIEEYAGMPDSRVGFARLDR